jgi:hypothetical protein
MVQVGEVETSFLGKKGGMMVKVCDSIFNKKREDYHGNVFF